MNKHFLQVAVWLGALSVALGAFGAHGLKNIVGEEALKIFETAVRYQFYHVFALALTGILYKEFSNRFLYYAGTFFIIGILLFSGSLYILTYKFASGFAGMPWIVYVTPFGGVCFIIGWICLALGLMKK